MNIEIGNIRTAFIYQGDDLIYPNYAAQENLVLHYDFSGIKNGDVTKDIAGDLSGNRNDGTLQNFAYEEGSGYLDNSLVFDGIDDFITIPKPQIDLDNFTYSEGGEVLSFRGESVATVVNGVVEIGGRNLIPNSKEEWSMDSKGSRLWYQVPLTKKDILEKGYYTISFEAKSTVPTDVYYISLAAGSQSKIYFVDKNSGERVTDEWVRYSFVANNTLDIITNIIFCNSLQYASRTNTGVMFIRNLKLKKGTTATPWAPSPEDLETTTLRPFFDKKIKSALYWNRALTDEELLQVYNTQIKRISE